MTSFVVDAYAWIEYLDGTERGVNVEKVLEDNANEFFTSSATLAEVISKFLRSKKDIKLALTALTTLSTIVSINQETAILAAQIHFDAKKKNKEFGMLDAFVAATAKKIGAKILTGDPDFRHFKESVII